MLRLFIGSLANPTVVELVIVKDDLKNELEVEHEMVIREKSSNHNGQIS